VVLPVRTPDVEAERRIIAGPMGEKAFEVPRYPGDWIPYGRVPLELIPEPDVGPLHHTTGLNVRGGSGKWTRGRRRLRAWRDL
jgi:hypothetical protein